MRYSSGRAPMGCPSAGSSVVVPEEGSDTEDSGSLAGGAEDSGALEAGVLEDGALLVVCDGMGGAKGGSTASSTASTTSSASR